MDWHVEDQVGLAGGLDDDGQLQKQNSQSVAIATTRLNRLSYYTDYLQLDSNCILKT